MSERLLEDPKVDLPVVVLLVVRGKVVGVVDVVVVDVRSDMVRVEVVVVEVVQVVEQIDCGHQEVLVGLGAILKVRHEVHHLLDLGLAATGIDEQQRMVELTVPAGAGVQEAQLRAVKVEQIGCALAAKTQNPHHPHPLVQPKQVPGLGCLGGS